MNAWCTSQVINLSAIDSIEDISGQLVYSAGNQEDDLHSELEAIARENLRSKGVKVNERQHKDMDLQDDEFTGERLKSKCSTLGTNHLVVFLLINANLKQFNYYNNTISILPKTKCSPIASNANKVKHAKTLDKPRRNEIAKSVLIKKQHLSL